MELLTYLFSTICGQSRCLVIDGIPLPVCQRCLGLYVGALLTALWLLGWGLWRRGLPGPRAVILEAAALVAAMLGGLHVLDFGPIWRLQCGLWSGHVAMVWLVGGAVELRALSRPRGALMPAWPERARFAALAAPLALAVVAWSIVRLLSSGWWIWSLAAALGLMSLGVAGGLAAVGVLQKARVVIRGMVQLPSRS
jgi:hypothetical protein